MSVAVSEMPCQSIETTRFGCIEINDDHLVYLNDGLIGFETQKEFGLIEHTPGSPFCWLQSMTDPALAFVVVNPFDFFDDYDFTINDNEVEELCVSSAKDVAVLTLVTINGDQVSTNLVGPILMNWRTRAAKQVVLSDSRYGTRHSLLG